MSRDWTATDNEGRRFNLDMLITQERMNGQSTGARRIAAIVEDRAVEAFKKGNDAEAKMFRDLVNTIKKCADELDKNAHEHEIEFPFELDKKKKA